MTLGRFANRLTEALLRSADYRETTQAGRAEPEVPHYVITISREAGALGSSVARAAGDILGWPVYDQELLNKIGHHMGTQIDMLQLIDEKPVNWLEQSVVNLVSDYNLSHDSYMVHLIAIVRALAEQGHCILVGRGANFLSPSDRTLRVRLVGERKDRIARMQESLKLTEKAATRWVETKDRERRDFVRLNFGQQVEDAHLYDLVLNTSRLSVPECARLIVTQLHAAQQRPQSVQVPSPVGVS
jgi:cytidylate kinase